MFFRHFLGGAELFEQASRSFDPATMSRSLAGSRLGSRSPSPEQGPQRKISAPAYYATPSYITIEKSKTRKSSFKKFGVQKESQPDKHMYDPSLLFARTNRWVKESSV